jgi:hypothetical protein
MKATQEPKEKSAASRRERASETRRHAPERRTLPDPRHLDDIPAAGAHAAFHLVNEDATPGAGVLPSHGRRSGKEVDGAAG